MPVYECTGFQANYQCVLTLGTSKCIGNGTSKQTAKQDAARKMLEMMGLSSSVFHLPTEVLETNAISQLNEYCSKNRLPYAEYVEASNTTQGQFVIVCKLQEYMTEGVDFIKKQAKQKASQNMLYK